MALLRHPRDRLPIFLVYLSLASTIVCIASPSWLGTGTYTLFVLISMLGRLTCLPHQHNHSHLETFHSKTINLFHDIVLAFLTGYTTMGWKLQHVFGHHRMLQQRTIDPTFVGRFAKPDGTWQSRVIHSVAVESVSFVDSLRVARGLPKKVAAVVRYRLLFEVFYQHGLYAITILLNPVASLLLVFGYNKILRLLVVKSSYDHHYTHGLDVHDESIAVPVNNNLPSPWYLFNLGYHEMHHKYPSLHWSDLPERHHGS